MEYFIPESDVLFEEEIKKSRFLTYLRHTENMAQAKAFWQEMKVLHPHARHWCWATVAGHPTDSQQYGFSDDGEPAGTAGKPMLNYLLGSGLGEITAVVVRYYGGGVQQALLAVKKQKKVLRKTYHLNCSYEQFNTVSHLLSHFDVEIIDQQFTDQVRLALALHPAEIETIQAQLTQRFSGSLQLEKER